MTTRQVTIPWDADRLADRVKSIKPGTSEKDKQLHRFFAKVSLGHYNDPVIIIDKFGAILAWHLPSVLQEARIVRIHSFTIGQSLNSQAEGDQHQHRLYLRLVAGKLLDRPG